MRRYNSQNHLGLALSWRQIFQVLLTELMLFMALYLLYYISIDPDAANSFASSNIFLYSRGVLPIIALTEISDDRFFFTVDPTWQCLVSVLILDYIVLALATVFFKKAKIARGDESGRQ